MALFDHEISLVGDAKKHIYCGCISNVMTVTPARGDAYTVFVQPPSLLFKLLKDVFKMPRPKGGDEVVMYLDSFKPERAKNVVYILVVEYTRADGIRDHFDVCTYTAIPKACARE